jgi:hypothetical protein
LLLLSANYKNIYDGIDRQNHGASAKETAFTDIFRRTRQTKLRTIRVLPAQLKWHAQPNAHFFAPFLPAAM